MNNVDVLKFVNVLPPAAIVNNASFTTTAVDTAGAGFVQFLVQLGATDIAFTVMKIQGSDDNSTNWTDILAAGTALTTEGTTSVLPTATDDNNLQLFEIDNRLLTAKRYMRLVLTIGSGSAGGFATCVAILSRTRETLITSTARGLEQAIRTPNP